MSKSITLSINRLPHAYGLSLPSYMSENASGMDLCAAVKEGIELKQGEYRLLPTGIAVAIPVGYEGQVRPRSGLAFRHGITILNSPGTIDSDYRGEIKVLLINFGFKSYMIQRGERIAQLVIHAVTQVEVSEVNELPASTRGKGGFGHTGSF